WKDTNAEFTSVLNFSSFIVTCLPLFGWWMRPHFKKTTGFSFSLFPPGLAQDILDLWAKSFF
ncbi:MAG: hypothetical protein K2X66_16360, partial [Cyanobacteria bacterium]|nr:hypothetical protein [Cyanobacteriota bacterium]